MYTERKFSEMADEIFNEEEIDLFDDVSGSESKVLEDDVHIETTGDASG